MGVSVKLLCENVCCKNAIQMTLDHLLCTNFNLVVGGGNNHILRREITDVYCELVGVTKSFDVSRSASKT